MNIRARLLGALADRLEAQPAAPVLRVAVDGPDGAGKTTFADELAEVLRGRGRTVIRASADGFHAPRAVRYRRGRASPEGFYRDSYDLAGLRAALLDPLGPGARDATARRSSTTPPTRPCRSRSGSPCPAAS